MRKRTLLTVLFLFVVYAMPITYIIGFTPASPSPGPITQVLVRVEHNGWWHGYYRYTIVDGIVKSVNMQEPWYSNETKTVTLTRPIDLLTDSWNVTAYAIKMNDSNDVLTIKIMETNGTILKEASTNSPYGLVQISMTFQTTTKTPTPTGDGWYFTVAIIATIIVATAYGLIAAMIVARAYDRIAQHIHSIANF